MKKARTARWFDMNTGEIGKLSQPGGPLFGIEHSNGGLITFPGGVPLKDNKGNVIGFDSTYTSFYSNVDGDTIKMDSLMRNFDRHFNLGKTSFFNRELDSLFFNDSLRYPDFFHDDFFLRRYELNDLYLRNMMHRMDSLKNNFYRQHSLREKNDESSDL